MYYFEHLWGCCVLSLGWFVMKQFQLWTWGTEQFALPPGCWCVWKCWYLEGILWFTSKGCIFFTGLLSPHNALSPRYLFHVLRNSIAPSPLVQARHLDRLDPTTRSQWIREWRSLRGGGQVKRHSLSIPPSPTPEPRVNMYPQSPVSTLADEITLNVIAENYLRPRHTWDTTTWLQLYYLFWKM